MNDHILECFRLLDLKSDASRDEVRRAYREQVKVWHPDRFQDDRVLHSKAQERLKQINLAYEQIEQFLDSPKSPVIESRAPTEKVQSEETAADQFKKGLACYNAGQIKAALNWYLKAADQGLADAQYGIGKIYFYHRRSFMFDGGKHFKECLFWFTKAAAQGHADAQYMVGKFHQGGFGTPFSATEAKKWYALAAKQGHRKAKQRLTWWGLLWGYYE